MPRESYDSIRIGLSPRYYDKTGSGRRKILIVDDDEISCAVLCRILEENYDTLVARNGQEALDVLESQDGNISLVLLDLMMPVVDGYEFLDQMMKDKRFCSIPVIVTTAKDQEEDEIWCLERGAVDFVSKPYNPGIVRRRVDRIIHLRETSAILNEVERDKLTGLYRKEFFYIEVERLLAQNPCRQYDMVAADVENFKVVNERLGVKIGDKVLCHMADRYRRILGNHGIGARLHGDVFVMLVEHGDGSWKKDLLWQWDGAVSEIPLHSLVIKYGIYEKVDHSMPPFGMCDRAILALNRIKKQYGRDIAIYNDSLRVELLREQQILDTMEDALNEHQFKVFYQPKYDINDNCISGAEALVRWEHPEFGFMSPAEFVPLFEQNGFITKLDFYVWEETCKNIRQWIDGGHKAVPVSVNISRIDFELPDLAEQIIGLVDSYGLDRGLLHLEITESVYTDDPQHIIQTVNRLWEGGFKIEMDDFGSGYSSLNMLSELSIDVLKLDMKFIQENSKNRNSILGFIISLSKWMNLETVAEGVENKEQVDKLRRYGCDYVQGYYYAKPMPKEEFEHYLAEDLQRKEEEYVNEPDGDALIPNWEEQRTNTVLVAEDSEMNRAILKHMLEPCFFVKETSNGKEAYDYLSTHPDEVSVVILDMVMPVMDGFQFMKLRNQEEKLLEIPVIIASESEEDSELMALRLGAERFIGKPYDKELLLLSIRHAIEWKEGKRVKRP